jgi:quercetin dioxygenase-like cupin family protein
MRRRTVLETIAAAGASALFAPLLAAAAERSANGVTPVFTQELPTLTLDGWKMTAVEVSYAPGQDSPAHKHPGFVFGYILEGEMRFKLDGGEETVYHAGQMFYEKPGSVHRVSANASATKPCRFLAMVFADKTREPTEPV